ncbi:nucleoside triphosphate pyrophosphohydrolase family protein [Candidatus Parcubacteria bacterium]|nr:nucleoside triphosphate pyrophosphohydrolase family protein [Candidatus Parcubacteria bacterium]
MTLNEYQEQAKKTALYPNVGKNIIYPTLGLTGEAGEIANKVKKIMRDDNGIMTDEKKKEIGKELGDVLWYVAQIARELDVSLDEVANNNLEKLFSRLERGTIQGSGDNR